MNPAHVSPGIRARWEQERRARRLARMPGRTRIRWAVAKMLDRSVRTCWADLAWWVHAKPGDGQPLITTSAACRVECGGCYCGKFRPDTEARWECRRRLARAAVYVAVGVATATIVAVLGWIGGVR